MSNEVNNAEEQQENVPMVQGDANSEDQQQDEGTISPSDVLAITGADPDVVGQKLSEIGNDFFKREEGFKGTDLVMELQAKLTKEELSHAAFELMIRVNKEQQQRLAFAQAMRGVQPEGMER